MRMKYNLKITDWQYIDSQKKKYNERDFMNFIDSSYTSLQQFLQEVETQLQDSFESQRKIQEWQNLKGMIVTPQAENMDKILTTVQTNLKNVIIDEDNSTIVECKNSHGELEFTIETNLAEDEVLNIIRTEQEVMSYKLVLPFTRAFHTTINELIDEYTSKVRGNFSLEDKIMVSNTKKKYGLLNISNALGWSVFIMHFADFELKTI